MNTNQVETTLFEVTGWTSISEHHSYGDGCLPDTAQHDSGSDVFSHNMLSGILHQLLRWTGAPFANVMLNAADVEGRIDIRVMEGDDGEAAPPYMLDLWKNKRVWLWDTIYTFHVKKVTRTEEIAELVSDELLKNFTKLPVDETVQSA